ncbi:MAG: exosome complex RNA-binding protein Csl4 [Candidatus Aenigmatarchaeota archaeon]
MSEESKSKKLVLPGDKVGTSEEWLAGEGTFEDGGNIYATQVGRLVFDDEALEAKVEAMNPIVEVEKGDIIYGSVFMRKESMVVIMIEKVEGVSRDVKEDVEGTLHISEVSDDYTEKLKDEFLVGDIIRAKVTQVEPAIKLSTVGKNFGVVSGNCPKCRKPMEFKRKKGKLYCENCEVFSDRNIARVYGKIKLKR